MNTVLHTTASHSNDSLVSLQRVAANFTIELNKEFNS